MPRARTILLLLATVIGCYGTPRTSFPDEDAGSGMAGGAGTGSGGTGRAGTGQAGSGAGGITGTGTAGTGANGAGGSVPAFVGGPCVVTILGSANVEVFARTASAVFHRNFDGRTWSSWATLAGLDATLIDARSDLDCGASLDTIHIVAAGLNPVGALEHAFGFGTSYNPFGRELAPRLVTQSPSVALLSNRAIYFGWAASGQSPGLVYAETGSGGVDLTPIPSLTNNFVSAADISPQLNALFFAAFDSDGKLAIYRHNMSSGGAMWIDSTKIESPGFFAFGPSICAESGLSGSFSINVAAVTGHDLWFSGTDRASGWPQFSTWTKISSDAASSPDCAVLRENPGLDPIIHVVMLTSRGTVTDLVGNGTSWATTDLGSPP